MPHLAACLYHPQRSPAATRPGDYPYWAPEYSKAGEASFAADIFCFGLILVRKALPDPAQCWRRRACSLRSSDADPRLPPQVELYMGTLLYLKVRNPSHQPLGTRSRSFTSLQPSWQGFTRQPCSARHRPQGRPVTATADEAP